MARPVVLSNGELHVGLNKWGLVHDFYFPYVGLENHAAGGDLRHRIGVWVEGKFSWLDSNDWAITSRYPHSALIGHTIATNETLGVALEFDDFVDAHISGFLRNIHVVNLTDRPREIRLFLHQAFTIGDTRSNTDTAQYLPDSNALIHYHGRRVFIISGTHNDAPFDQYTVGLFGIEGFEGSYRDAEDGELGFGAVEHGKVDSVLRFTVQTDAHSSGRVHYWIAAGTSARQALFVHKKIQKDGLTTRLHSTADWWHEWLSPAYDIALRITPEHRESFIRSLMIVKSHIDKHGAIIASTDTSVLNYSRDAYAYCWPRDGALTLWPLIRLGYVDEPRRFFEFCKQGLQPDGYLMHKYRADGALGSSWHPYIHSNGLIGPPIQEDETALTLFMFAQFYQKTPSPRLLADFYQSMVTPMANFLSEYVDKKTGLPKPSYDLWEEVYLTSTFTTSVVYGALVAASDLATLSEDEDNAVKWRTAAEDIQRAAQKYLFNHDRQAFYKGVVIKGGEIIERNDTVDTSSFFGAFMFGLFTTDSIELQQAADTTKQALAFSYETPHVPRYENDNYYRISPQVLGNYWHVTSLWMAQYELEIGNAEIAHQTLAWTKRHMLASGVLSEQVDPQTGANIGIAPLTWSHAEYIATLLDTITEISAHSDK
jgi:GH15 family glucan-1,4-alpha-glucosidase